jgi:hypothetical protein
VSIRVAVRSWYVIVFSMWQQENLSFYLVLAFARK